MASRKCVTERVSCILYGVVLRQINTLEVGQIIYDDSTRTPIGIVADVAA